MSAFQWTTAREEAAQMLADDRLTDEQIASKVGITRRALAKWKNFPEFAERVSSIVEAERKAILKRGIAVKANRVGAQNNRWRKLERVMEARANDPLVRDVPGGDTGLIVPEPMLLKVQGYTDEDGHFIPTGESQIVYVYKLDTGLLKEARDLEKQAAIEVEQWTERVKHSGDEEAPVTFTLKLSDADVHLHAPVSGDVSPSDA